MHSEAEGCILQGRAIGTAMTLHNQQAGVAAVGNEVPFTYGRGAMDGDLYLTSGTLTDWAFGELGLLAYSVELRPTSYNPGFLLGPEYIRTSGAEAMAATVTLAGYGDP